MAAEPHDEKSVAFSNPREQKGWVQLPNWMLLDGTISSHAVRFYSVLAYYAREKEEAFPGMEKIASSLGLNVKNIRRYRDELVELGVLSYKRRGLGKTNLYRLTSNPDRAPAPFQEGAPVPEEVDLDELERPSGYKEHNPQVSADVQIVYDHWRTKRHRDRSNYDRISAERRKKIQARLKDFTVAELCEAIDGVAYDPWPERGLHDDLTKIFRSHESVDKFLELRQRRPTNGHGTPAPSLTEMMAIRNGQTDVLH